MSDDFWANVAPPDANGCMRWLGSYSSAGYGSVQWDSGDGRGRRSQGAHRVAFQLAHGPIRPGWVIMHSCDNRWCVAPEHLSQGTTRDNAHDRADKHRGRGQRRGGRRPPAGRRYW